MRCIRAKTMYTPEEKLEDAWIIWDEETGAISRIGTGPLPVLELGSSGETAGGAREKPTYQADDGILCPGFIDIHVHGGFGQDPVGVALSEPNSCTRARETILKLAQYEASVGVTGFLPTTGAVPDQVNLSVIKTVREIMTLYEPSYLQKSSRGPFTSTACPGSQVLGVNLEGPYISPKKKGAQPGEFIQEPSLEKAKRLIEPAPGVVKIMTLAPEVPGSLEVIEYLREKGIVVSLGHSDASYAEARRGMDAGITHSTHVFSAMRGFHHREPGALGAVLLDPRVSAELIMDGIHVHPAAASLLLRLKGIENIALITDAISAAGLKDGEYSLYGASVKVANGAATMEDDAGKRVLAGSTLNMVSAVKNMVQMVGVDMKDALKMASEIPARIIGVFDRKGSLAAGKDADLVLLNKDFSVKRTFVNGREVYPRLE